MRSKNLFKKTLILMATLLLSSCSTGSQNNASSSMDSDGVAFIHTYGDENVTINYDKETYYVGDTVRFSITPSEDIEVISVTANYKKLTPEDGIYSFVAKISNSIRFTTKTKEGQKETIGVILLSGQSNMEGNTNSFGLITNANGFTNEEISAINAGYDGVKINYISYYKGSPSNVNKSNGFIKTKLGQGNPSGSVRFGPEVGIAETLHNNGYDNKVVLIKCAVGASILAPEANEWMGSAPYYNQFVDLIDSSLSILENQGYHPVIKAFCWMQGESDAGNSSYTSNYAKNLNTFVGQFKTRYNDYVEGNFRFIDGYISTSSVWTYATQMNAQKQKFADERDWAVTIDTNAECLSVGNPGGDKYHYNVYSEFKLGKLFGEEIIKSIK